MRAHSMYTLEGRCRHQRARGSVYGLWGPSENSLQPRPGQGKGGGIIGRNATTPHARIVRLREGVRWGREILSGRVVRQEKVWGRQGGRKGCPQIAAAVARRRRRENSGQDTFGNRTDCAGQRHATPGMAGAGNCPRRRGGLLRAPAGLFITRVA